MDYYNRKGLAGCGFVRVLAMFWSGSTQPYVDRCLAQFPFRDIWQLASQTDCITHVNCHQSHVHKQNRVFLCIDLYLGLACAIDHEAGEIIRLVASVCLPVCLCVCVFSQKKNSGLCRNLPSAAAGQILWKVSVPKISLLI